jgi:hypothetical protein
VLTAACTVLCGCTGVVPRPGDPNYIPSQLGTIWHKAGGLWVYQQQRKEQQLLQSQQQLGGLQHAATLDIMDLMPVPPPVDAHVDWPWRPRDLEALLTRFHLLVDGHRAGVGASKDPVHSVLSYDGFLAFWDESGVRQLLGKVSMGCRVQAVSVGCKSRHQPRTKGLQWRIDHYVLCHPPCELSMISATAVR